MLYRYQDDRLIRGERVRCGPGTRAVQSARQRPREHIRGQGADGPARSAYPYVFELGGCCRLTLVSETITLDQVEAAFHKMERGEVLRSVVVL